MNGRGSGWVTPSIVTWSSCIDSSSAAWVFGEARLISSTSSRFVKTGPGRNSNSFDLWLKTFTPVTSDGSRSGVNCRRENELSTERESAFASIVFPTPGKSSMIRCPSLTRQRTQRRSVSSGARTTRARLSTMVRRISAEEATETGSLPARSIALQQPLDLVEDLAGDLVLRSPRHLALAFLRQQHDLVVYRVESDVVTRHVVVDDEVDGLVAELVTGALEAVLARLRRETHEQSAVRPTLAEDREHVQRRLQRDRPRRAVLRPLAGVPLGRAVVGDGRRHHDEVGVGTGQHLAREVVGGGRRHELHAVRRRDGEICAHQRDLGPTSLGLGREGHAHPARGAVAEEAHGVERLARAACSDDDALSREPAVAAGEQVRDPLRDLPRLG